MNRLIRRKSDNVGMAVSPLGSNITVRAMTDDGRVVDAYRLDIQNATILHEELAEAIGIAVARKRKKSDEHRGHKQTSFV